MSHRDHNARGSAAHHISAGRDMSARASTDRARHLKLQARRAKEIDKRALGPALGAALALDSVTQTHLSIACGVDQPQVSRWHSPDHPDAPTVLHVRLAALAGLVHWARAASVHELPPVKHEPEGERTARIVRTFLGVPACVTAHLVDGRRDGYERSIERTRLLEARAEIDQRLALLDYEDEAEQQGRAG